VSKPEETPLTFSPHEWEPLPTAFDRIMSVFLTRNRTLFYLNRDLRSGRLRSARVQISDGKKTMTLLSHSDWEQLTVHTSILDPIEGVRVDPYVPGEYFVCRVDLDKWYPIAATPTMTAAHQSDQARPPERRRGPVTTHDWHSIDGEIARRCIDPKTGRVLVPKSERMLARQMLAWCQEKYEKEPAESEMREAVKAICAALRSHK